MLFLIILTRLLFALSCEEPIPSDKYFSSFDNTKIRYRVYQATNQTKKDVILFVQGRNEFIEKYDHFYGFLNKLGYQVYTFDLRGQGRSDGARCNIDRYDTYVRDLNEFIKNIPLIKGQKIDLIAHSAGGLITIIYLQKEDVDHKINKVILSSPFLGIISSTPPFLLEIYFKLRSLIKSNDAVNQDFKENNQTHDEVLYNKFKNNDLKCGKPAYGWVAASVRAFDSAFSNIKRTNRPLTILVSDTDTIVDVNRTKEFCREATANCELVEFKGMYHELLNEVGRGKVFQTIQAHL